MRRAILLGYIILLSQHTWSQIYQPVERYTIANGLSHCTITCLFQDRIGFLWVGTTNGLNRFDGNTFIQYRANHFDSTALTGHYIKKIAEDFEGNLWCATNRGISKLNRNSNFFHSFYQYSDSAHKTISASIKDVAIDMGRNQMYVLTDEYFSRMDLAAGSVIRINTGTEITYAGLNAVDKLAFHADDDALYIYSKKSLFKYNVSTGSLQQILTEENKSILKNEPINGIFSGIGGECWLYTNSHVWLLDEKPTLREVKISKHRAPILFAFQRNPEEICFVTNDVVFSYQLQTKVSTEIFKYQLQLAPCNSITAFLNMDNDIFWMGSAEGLFKINQHEHLFTIYDLGLYPVSLNNPISMVYDGDGMLWFSSEEGQIAVIDPAFSPGPKALKAFSDQKKKIYSMKPGLSGNVLCATAKGLFELKLFNNKISGKALIEGIQVDAFHQDNSDSIWFSSGTHVYTVSASGQFDSFSIDLTNFMNSPAIDLKHIGNSLYILERYNTIKHSIIDSSNALFSLSQLNLQVLPDNNCLLPADDKTLLIGTSYGAFIFYLYDFKVLPNYLNSGQMKGSVHSIIQDKNQKLWISTNLGLYSFDKISSDIRTYTLSDGLPMQSYNDRMASRSPDGELCFYGDGKFVIFNPDSLVGNTRNPTIVFTDVILFDRNGQRSENLVGKDTIVVDTKYNQLLFHCAVLDFWDPSNNTYKYSIQHTGKMGKWVDLSTKNSFYIAGLHDGDYILKIKGAGHNQLRGESSKSIVLRIVAPIWRSRIAIILYAIVFLSFFYLTVLFTTRQLRHLNKQYRERELIAKKVEIQKEELTLKNKNITDSINYAKRIQMALMPSAKLFKKFFPDSFILHIPKDIVSGDFYWVNEVEGRVYFGAVDCTGHGVPGAFMSIIGFDLFRRITEIEKKKQPAEILNSLSQGFETIFRDIEDITLRDGMDAAFCAIDPEFKVLEFSGAFNPLYLVRDNTITEIKGDRFSVGLSYIEDAIPVQQFKDHVIPLIEDDVIYIFTDGYADQFGGPEGKKYKYRRFRHLLLALHQLPMERQMEFLRRSIMDWKGDLDQVDDILIMGIRIHHNK